MCLSLGVYLVEISFKIIEISGKIQNDFGMTVQSVVLWRFLAWFFIRGLLGYKKLLVKPI